MSHTTPNKEIIRRLCLLFRLDYCYLLTDTQTEYVDIFVNISNEKKNEFLEELESWSGMKFRVFNVDSNKNDIYLIQTKGEKIYPVSIYAQFKHKKAE